MSMCVCVCACVCENMKFEGNNFGGIPVFFIENRTMSFMDWCRLCRFFCRIVHSNLVNQTMSAKL